jgi:hypothetical protein
MTVKGLAVSLHGVHFFAFCGFASHSAWRLASSASIAGVMVFDFGATDGERTVRR